MSSTTQKNDHGPPQKDRLIIVSNRLPVVLSKGNGQWHADPSSGGLVTALAPVLKNRGGLWIGWPGTHKTDGKGLNQILAAASLESGFTLKPVMLSLEEVEKYYYGFANEIIWPQFHDLLGRCNFDPSYWPCYQKVNSKFAGVIYENLKSNDYIWIQDYHLIPSAQALRGLGVKNKIGFFLHIPFPPLDIFMKLPWRFQLMQSLLHYDLVGFQTMRDCCNFKQCASALIKGVSFMGKGQVVTLKIGDTTMRVGAFPISIDFNEFAGLALDGEVAELTRKIEARKLDMQIILGIDRMDYTKGIPERLQAFKNALDRYPDLRSKVTLVQVVVPSRYHIPEYQSLKERIERLVGEINGQFACVGWVPIHYFFRSLDRKELVAHYRAADMVLITPLKDGMNLIAKEYCAANIDNNGIVILSEFAGATAQMQGAAILVNPHDVEGVADAIHSAFVMPCSEKEKRMKILRDQIRHHDIYQWLNSFLKAAMAKQLDNFTMLEEYKPQLHPMDQKKNRRRTR